jgi:hypothetical protein
MKQGMQSSVVCMGVPFEVSQWFLIREYVDWAFGKVKTGLRYRQSRFVLMTGLPRLGRRDCLAEPDIVHPAVAGQRPEPQVCIEQRFDGTKRARAFQADPSGAERLFLGIGERHLGLGCSVDRHSQKELSRGCGVLKIFLKKCLTK